jgi:hypothetical protein
MALTKVNTDLLADGGKLNGIEAGADVTDTTNVTAAGALMDSELTSIASVKALDQGVATTDSPTFAGLNASGNLTLDVAGDIVLNADGGDWLFNDGAVTLGSLQNDGNNNLIVMSNTNDKDIKFLGIDNSNTITALTLDMSAAGAATFNDLINIGGSSLNFTKVDGVGINAKESLSITIDSDNNDASRVFSVLDGNGTTLMQVTDAGEATFNQGAVFNEAGVDSDFRVESDGNANMLFVDGGANRVGIGKVPSSTLTVSNTANSDGGLIADFGGYDAGQRLIVANYSCGSDESRAGLYWENQGVVNMRMWMADTGKLYLKSGNPTSSTDGDRILTDQANVGGTGDRGFNIPNGDRLGFDQTGTRSWTVKAAGGALTIQSGDGNGEVTIAPYFHAAKGLTIGSTTGLAVSTTGWGREYVLSADYNSLARTVTLHTNASYFQAKVTIATQQSNGGNDNNRWIEGVWSNNHTTHLWKEFVDVGYTGINETITAGVGNSGSNSGKLVIARAYQASASGTFRVKIENVGYITGMTWAVT